MRCRVFSEDLFAGINLHDISGPDFFGDFGLGGGLFDRMFGRRSGLDRGRIEMLVRVPFEGVLHGGPEPIQVRRPARCSSCKGSGAKAGTESRKPRQMQREAPSDTSAGKRLGGDPADQPLPIAAAAARSLTTPVRVVRVAAGPSTWSP